MKFLNKLIVFAIISYFLNFLFVSVSDDKTFTETQVLNLVSSAQSQNSVKIERGWSYAVLALSRRFKVMEFFHCIDIQEQLIKPHYSKWN